MDYSLIFILHKNNVLMLNRNFPPAMGTWSGIGGFKERNEDIWECAEREIREEIGRNVANIKTIGGYNSINSSIFYSISNEKFNVYNFNEGILDWKTIEWVLDSKNKGVEFNIKVILSKILKDINDSK